MGWANLRDISDYAFVVAGFAFFQRHILELAGLEDIATFLAFHIFRVFVARDDLHPGMLALLPAGLWRGLRGMVRSHKFPVLSVPRRGFPLRAGKWSYFRTPVRDVKYPWLSPLFPADQLPLSYSPVETC